MHRNALLEKAKAMIDTPELPSNIEAERIFNFISLGAGVQSSTMALMAAAGEITPMPDAAIFADTHAELASVYRWLAWLETRLPFPVHRVSRGSLTEYTLKLHDHKNGKDKWVVSGIPAFSMDGKTAEKGMYPRQCTFNFKIRPIEKAVRRLASVKRGEKTIRIHQWIGISWDEVHRMKPSRQPWIKNIWPLIDLRMKRDDCLEWMERREYPKPPRSACIYCPFHGDIEWLRLKEQEPEEFEKAVAFDRDYRALCEKATNRRSMPYVHRSCVPLDQVDFSAARPEWFGNECEGMCGV